jgi:hypothetical protein
MEAVCGQIGDQRVGRRPILEAALPELSLVPMPVVMDRVFGQDPPQVRIVEDQHPVELVAPICPGRCCGWSAFG